jgi:hypothetical protein
VLPENFRVDFIKIDVEGGELLVMKGAAGIMKKYKPVVIFEHGLGRQRYIRINTGTGIRPAAGMRNVGVAARPLSGRKAATGQGSLFRTVPQQGKLLLYSLPVITF